MMERFWDLLAPLPPAPANLEARRGASQCSFEVLRAFAGYANSQGIRFTLGAGTLLGAMRNRPPGLLKWEHDVDVYVPALAFTPHAVHTARRAITASTTPAVCACALSAHAGERKLCEVHQGMCEGGR